MLIDGKTQYSLRDETRKIKEIANTHRAKAVKEFGYTPYFMMLGIYCLTGKCSRNLSGEKEKGKHFGFVRRGTIEQ